jgi:RimJ/RimL family protein N-acetyltransferase
MAPPIASLVRRLSASDAAEYQALRLEGFLRHPLDFRIAPEDECRLSPAEVGDRLEREFVAGGFQGDKLMGTAGLSRFEGTKLRHRGLLWGMYVREEARGSGMADQLMELLLNQAGLLAIKQVILTVAAENLRARRLYERWGFSVYGVEPAAIQVDDAYYDEALMIRRLDP